MNCCSSCVTEQTIKIPGSEGIDGVDGANGTDGVDGLNGGNAVATIIAQTPMPTVPHVGDTVIVIVSNGNWIVVGQLLMFAVNTFTVCKFEVLGMSLSGSNVQLVLEAAEEMFFSFPMQEGYHFIPTN